MSKPKWTMKVEHGGLYIGDAPGGNYRKKMIGLDLPPEVYHQDVYHDDWCAIYKGGQCNCNPDIRIRKAKTS